MGLRVIVNAKHRKDSAVPIATYIAPVHAVGMAAATPPCSSANVPALTLALRARRGCAHRA